MLLPLTLPSAQPFPPPSCTLGWQSNALQANLQVFDVANTWGPTIDQFQKTIKFGKKSIWQESIKHFRGWVKRMQLKSSIGFEKTKFQVTPRATILLDVLGLFSTGSLYSGPKNCIYPSNLCFQQPNINPWMSQYFEVGSFTKTKARLGWLPAACWKNHALRQSKLHLCLQHQHSIWMPAQVSADPLPLQLLAEASRKNACSPTPTWQTQQKLLMAWPRLGQCGLLRREPANERFYLSFSSVTISNK